MKIEEEKIINVQENVNIWKDLSYVSMQMGKSSKSKGFNDDDERDNNLLKQEIIMYLQEKHDILANPYTYWKTKKTILPKLAVMARIYLAPPPGSAPSERIFSLTGNIQTEKRNSLTIDHLNMLTFLKFNYLKLHPEIQHLIKKETIKSEKYFAF